MGQPVVEVRELGKNYGKRRGVEGLSFAVAENETFGFLGPNGAGKTTTIRLLLGLLRPDRGEIRLCGQAATPADWRIHKQIGFLPGDFTPYDSLTGWSYLRFFARFTPKVDEAFIAELAGRLDCELGAPIRTLSLGNRRKIGLIRALQHRPRLLLLDEPTAGLDPLVQHTFCQLLAEARQRGQTVFLSSHNLTEVERLCDRAAIIRQGQIVAVEPVARVSALRQRRVEIAFSREAATAAFAALPGVTIEEAGSRRILFRVHGPLDGLLAAALPFGVDEVTSREPSLEEVFLAHYGHGGQADG